MMNEKKHGIGHNIRQAVLVTVVCWCCAAWYFRCCSAASLL